jgi:NAD(P)-dependent dehydrogenase (short-subunit alcohol dehydrogenase family)|tara:strand:- start:987 stop:1100 length:114 start_codon:yes stop_codon:yes gene_type:complete
MEIEVKAALVTGAASGIGLGTARLRLARRPGGGRYFL